MSSRRNIFFDDDFLVLETMRLENANTRAASSLKISAKQYSLMGFEVAKMLLQRIFSLLNRVVTATFIASNQILIFNRLGWVIHLGQVIGLSQL